ncbi:MAG: hypothetical protein ACJAU1_001567, partial [Psychromonas sp.]
WSRRPKCQKADLRTPSISFAAFIGLLNDMFTCLQMNVHSP